MDLKQWNDGGTWVFAAGRIVNDLRLRKEMTLRRGEKKEGKQNQRHRGSCFSGGRRVKGTSIVKRGKKRKASEQERESRIKFGLPLRHPHHRCYWCVSSYTAALAPSMQSLCLLVSLSLPKGGHGRKKREEACSDGCTLASVSLPTLAFFTDGDNAVSPWAVLRSQEVPIWMMLGKNAAAAVRSIFRDAPMIPIFSI